MLIAQRRRHILDEVRGRGYATFKELATAIGTSESTVRRDLRSLVAEGLVVLTRGGVGTPESLNPLGPSGSAAGATPRATRTGLTDARPRLPPTGADEPSPMSPGPTSKHPVASHRAHAARWWSRTAPYFSGRAAPRTRRRRLARAPDSGDELRTGACPPRLAADRGHLVEARSAAHPASRPSRAGLHGLLGARSPLRRRVTRSESDYAPRLRPATDSRSRRG